MLVALGASVTMCSVFSGETGRMLRHLISDEGIDLLAVDGGGRNGAYVHDRRGGERDPLVETGGQPLSRHDLDALYGLTIGAGLDVETVVLSGPTTDDELSADVYRRLAADLRTAGCRVIADLAGERLAAVLAGGIAVLKVSDEELVADGRIADPSEDAVVEGMYRLRNEGADCVIVTRAEKRALLLANDRVSEVHVPNLQVVDTHGAGDSLTAGVAAALAEGESIEDAVALGAAAGALNVTRHGLGTAEGEAVRTLRKRVRIEPMAPGGGAAGSGPEGREKQEKRPEKKVEER